MTPDGYAIETDERVSGVTDADVSRHPRPAFVARSAVELGSVAKYMARARGR